MRNSFLLEIIQSKGSRLPIAELLLHADPYSVNKWATTL